MSLKIESLSRVFNGKRIFFIEKLELPKEGLVHLKGPNGCGKTSLLKILATLTLPTTGDAWLDGISVTKSPHQARKIFSYMPAADSCFYPRLSGLENLMLFSAIFNMEPKSTAKKIEELKLAGILDSETLSTTYALCSSGMKKSLSLALCLSRSSKICLLDEPLLSLDKEKCNLVTAYLGSLKKDRLVLVATHQDKLADIIDSTFHLRTGVLE